MKLLIIEDEIPAQRLLQKMISEVKKNIEIVGCVGSVKAAVEWFKKNEQPDVVLLDIQLSDGISFNIFKEVNVESMIIFTTAFDEYVLQAFKVNSIDYILKPFDTDDLNKAFEKYELFNRKFIKEKNGTVNYDEIVSAIKNSKQEYRSRFLIQSGEHFYKLQVKDISYFYSSNKITFAVTFESREIPLDLSLEKLQEQLDPKQYFKINRQYIVNIDAILKVHTFFDGKLVVTTHPALKEKIIVGKDKAAEFKRWIDK
jgi:two-component system, LytTR family, response regulator LytT